MQPLIAFAVALLPLTFAAPTAEVEIVKRTIGNAYICTGPNFTNTCENLFVGAGSDWSANCKKLPEPWFGSIGSIGPDHQTLCRLFDSAHADCSGSGLDISQYPGTTNLYNSIDAGHKANYVSCITCTGCA